MRKFTASVQGAFVGARRPVLRSPETLQRCFDLALKTRMLNEAASDTRVLTEVACELGCTAQTIRNWRNRSKESPREYMVMLPEGDQEPFHLALKMALERSYVPAKGDRALKRRGVIVTACDDPALKVAPDSNRPPGSGARTSPADRAARSEQSTEQNRGIGSAPSGLKVGETAIIGGTLGKRMA
jgi:transposase-like protein